ncbi:MAG TPA: hypothetical protein VEB63_00070 [Chitinophagaceae bacterium]|nr:hypothetical protein [Chitinophagaceae bacterium]
MKRRPSLLFCVLMDLLGYASFSVPVVGELLDLAWAPVSSLIFLLAFGVRRGSAGAVFHFIEELLPGTDFIPSFTIMWFIQVGRLPSRRPLRLGSR